MNQKKGIVDIVEILKTLPHRYPFLLIDRVIELEMGKRIVALKNVSVNEPFFQGHFPGLPVMPGVLVIEAMAQAAGVLTYETLGMHNDDEAMFFFAGIDEARFKRMVTPGDQLHIEVTIDRKSRNLWKFSGHVTCDSQTVATAKMMCALAEVETANAPARQSERGAVTEGGDTGQRPPAPASRGAVGGTGGGTDGRGGSTDA